MKTGWYRRSVVSWVLGLFLMVGFSAGSFAGALVKIGDDFPDLKFPVPGSVEDREYLGLREGETFSVRDVQAELLVIEVLNVYCLTCQEQAPVYNSLFKAVEEDAELKGRVKILGIAAGNDELEIQEFRSDHQVRIPVAPDPDFETFSTLGIGETPFTLTLRLDSSAPGGVVAATHLGPLRGIQGVLEQYPSLLSSTPAFFREQGRDVAAEERVVKPVLSQKEVNAKIESLFLRVSQEVAEVRFLDLGQRYPVYEGKVRMEDGPARIFAVVVARPVPCDLCHDVHYIYVFDQQGRIIELEPLQLRKYGNEPFDEEDLAKLRKPVIGSLLTNPPRFDPRVDAVSSATITSAVVFNSLSEGTRLFEELKEGGIIGGERSME